MVALQEELDWECYRHYGLLDEGLTLPTDEIPDIDKGQRAFEIVLARKQAAGEIETSWFERHDSTPITEIPDEWPEAYRDLVQRRIDLIESDRRIRLLEKPEHKRRWNWDSWEEMQDEALRSWLLDRMEAEHLWDEPELTTTAKLADRLRPADEFVEVARIWSGQVDVELVEVVAKLATSEAVPYLADLRYRASGMRRRREWEKVWNLQRREDALDARRELPPDDPDHLDEEEAEVLKKEQVGEIPVPPKYRKSDYADDVTYRMRGRLDVPKERFILYPDTAIGADTSPVIGWAGWEHLEQAQALAAHYTDVRDEVGDPDLLRPLLAGVLELVPWLKQWHNRYDETYGQRLGDFFHSFVRSEATGLGATIEDLQKLTPVVLDDGDGR